MSFEVALVLDGADLVVRPSGAMTFQRYGESDQMVEQVFTTAKPGVAARIVFDLTAVEMIDSHWLGALVRVLKRAQERETPVVLRNARPGVRRLLDLVQFGRLFTIEA